MFNTNQESLPNGAEYLKNSIAVAAFILLCAVLTLTTSFSVLGQQVGTNIQVTNPESGAVGSQVKVRGTIDTRNSSYTIFFGGYPVANGTSDEYFVNTNFTVPGLPAGNYNVTLQDTISNQTDVGSFTITIPVIFSLSIMAVSLSLALLNSGLNRILISRFVGWNDYRTIQKEMAEWRSQQMAAARANDKKQLEKLKKKESQMMNMQKKMMKPQMLLLGFTLVYFLIWPVLTGFFPGSVIYIPGIGPQPFYIWYLLCSLFFGTLASRLTGITPME